MEFQASHRIRPLATGVFTEVANRKALAATTGLSIIDLSVGSPDLPPPPAVTDALSKGVKDPAKYGYTLRGSPAFADAVAHFYQTRYDVSLNPATQVIQLMGSQEGLSHLALAVVNPGDVVLVPDPGYPIYEANVRIAGADVYPMPLRAEHGFLPVLEDIPADILARARLMILNYPGNPVTALADQAFFERVVAFARRHELLVAHDFAYSELVFDGQQAISFLSVPGASDVGIEFNSLSKTFNLAGCRVGYAVGNTSALQALSLLKSHIDYGIFLPIEEAAVLALTGDVDAMLGHQAKVYETRRDALCTGLSQAGWHVAPSPATMFVWARIPDGWTSRQFAYQVLEQTGVAMTPGDAFGAQGEGYVRMALVQPAEVLAEAARRIGTFLAAQSR